MLRHLLFIFSCVILTLGKSVEKPMNKTLYYKGGVVQYAPDPLERASDQSELATNIQYYEMFIQAARGIGIDILVLPEYGLTSIADFEHRLDHFLTVKYEGSDEAEYDEYKVELEQRRIEKRLHFHKTTPFALKYRALYRDLASPIPNPEDKIAPCRYNHTYTYSLKAMSCSAGYNKVYVVLNHYEEVKCEIGAPDCPEDGFLLYNTNVVFDRNGRVVARYRKFSLQHEPWADGPAQPELSVFTTDFNVTFAQLVGLDLMNKHATDLILADPRVTNVVLSTWRFDKIPFLTSVQDRAAWAYYTDLNLLASGYSKDGTSEIYLGRRGMHQKYLKKSKNNIVVHTDIKKVIDHCMVDDTDNQNKSRGNSNIAEINPIPGEPTLYDFIDEHEDIQDYFDPGQMATQLLPMDKAWHTTQLCASELCCQFTVNTKFNQSLANREYYRYRLMVAKGMYKLAEESLIATEVCGLIGCTSDNLADCGKTFKPSQAVAPRSVLSLLITRYDVRLDNDSFSAPLALAGGEILTTEANFTYRASGEPSSGMIILELVRPTDDIEFFGIDVRRFNVEGWPVKSESSISFWCILTAIVVAVLVSVGVVVVCKLQLHSKYFASAAGREELVNENVDASTGL